MISENHKKYEPQLDRNSKSLTRYIDATSRLSVDPSFPISIPSKHTFAASEAMGSFPEQRNGNTVHRPQHKDSSPQFPLWIPKKHTFGLQDAVGNKPGRFSGFSGNSPNRPSPSQSSQFSSFALSDQMIAPTSENQFLENFQTTKATLQQGEVLDSTPSDQFLVPNILNFFQNPRFPSIASRPNRPNRVKRPPRPKGPPPSQQTSSFAQVSAETTQFQPVITQTSSFPPASSQTSSNVPPKTLSFSPVPSRPSLSSFQQQRIPNLQTHQSQGPGQDEALKIFNEGLDNFITNPGSFNEIPRPRPVNSIQGGNPLLSFPPGLTIEEKTKLLAERDPNQNFILSAPSVNAGVLPLKLQKQQPLILFPPLNRPLNKL